MSSQNINPNNPAPVSYPTSAQINTELQQLFENSKGQLSFHFHKNLVEIILSYRPEPRTIQDLIEFRQITIIDPLEALKSVANEVLEKQQCKTSNEMDFFFQTLRLIIIFEGHFLKFKAEQWLEDTYKDLFGRMIHYRIVLSKAIIERDYELIHAAVTIDLYSHDLYSQHFRVFRNTDLHRIQMYKIIADHEIKEDFPIIFELMQKHPERNHKWYKFLFRNRNDTRFHNGVTLAKNRKLCELEHKHVLFRPIDFKNSQQNKE